MAKSEFNGETGAALIFLIGYIGIFLWMGWHYYIHAIKWKSRWSTLFFHVIIRMASQGCGIAFSIVGRDNEGLFLAFLILGSEGYFTLVFCAFRFLISWHRHNFPKNISWLDPPQKEIIGERRWIIDSLQWYSPMFWFQFALILADAAIIVGGSYLSKVDYSNLDSAKAMRLLNVAKIARTSGQSVFLACNALLMVAIVATILRDKRHVHSRGTGRVHPTLWILFVAWFPLIVRGVWGVLQAAVWGLSYMNPENYTDHGFTDRFSALENILSVMTEWIACLLFLLTYYANRTDCSKKFNQSYEAHSLDPLL